MQHIYCPWRSDYFKNKVDGCVFCDISNNPNEDENNRVFYRDEICFGIMNLYPYTPGHFMIIPHKHVDTPSSLLLEEWLHIQKLSFGAFRLLEEYGCSGINTGINIKKAGGAGIPEHLHMHFVPRYIGDTNFITSIGDSRIYGINFDSIFEKIKALSKIHFKV